MTNAEKIKGLSDVELAKWLCSTHGSCSSWCPVSGDCDGEDCDRGLLDWLKQEAEE